MAKRRSNGEGTLRQRADGRWERTIMIGYSDDGKRKYKTFYGKTQAEVKAKAKSYQDAIDDGMIPEVNYLFSEWAEIWFENHRDNISPTTQENYRYTLRLLKEGFARRRIADVKPYDIETFLKKLRRDGRSYSSVAQCRGMLYQIFNKAEANDLIRKNPVRFAEKMRKTEPVKRKECFTAEEVSKLMELLPDDRMGWSIRLLLGTGMRTQELLALEPKHIETDGSCIHIRQAINMIKGTPVVGTPKSRDSYRDVPVPECVRECAIKLRSTNSVFVWEMKKKNAPCNPSTFREHFKRALKEVPEVRVLTPHSCRHTYVSQMQALGVDLATIQSIVGHADIDMTTHYLHVQEVIRQNAIAKFNQAFSVDVADTITETSGKILQFPGAG